MDGMRTCTKCGETKPLSDYHRAKGYRGGFRTQCKKCRNAHQRSYYEANLDQINARREANREQYNAQERARRAATRDQYNAQDRARRAANRDQYNAKQRARRAANRNQYNAKGSAYKKAQQSATRMAATHNNAPWTPEEDAYLLTTTDTATIAALNLGRTYSSVINRRTSLRQRAQKDTAA